MDALHQQPHILKQILDIKTGKTEYTYEDAYHLRKKFEYLTNIIPYPVNKEFQKKVDKALLNIVVQAVRTFDIL